MNNQFNSQQPAAQPQQGLFSVPAPTAAAKHKRQEVVANVGGHNAAGFAGFGQRTSFFIDGVKVLRPKKGQIFIGRILPARDHTMDPLNPAYATSVIPYRMPATAESSDPLGDFTGWFNAFWAYKMLGLGQRKIDTTSFRTRAAYGVNAESSDPVMDARNFAYAQLRLNNLSQGQVDYLCKRVGNLQTGRPAMLPREALQYKLNVWGAMYDTQARTWGAPEHGVHLLTGPGFEMLTNRLKMRLLAGMPPVDPVFQQLLYGDPTNIQYGLKVWTDIQRHGEVDCGTLVMASDDNNPQASMTSMSLEGPGLEEILKTRTTPALDQFAFMTYTEMFQFLVNDNKDPLFLQIMQAACAHAANTGANMSTGMPLGVAAGMVGGVAAATLGGAAVRGGKWLGGGAPAAAPDATGFPAQFQAPAAAPDATGFPQFQAPAPAGFPAQFQAPAAAPDATGFPQFQAPAGFPAQFQAPAAAPDATGFPQFQAPAPAGFPAQFQAPAAAPAPAGFPAQFQAPAAAPAPAGFPTTPAFNPGTPTPIQQAAVTYKVGAESKGGIAAGDHTLEQVAALLATTPDLRYLDTATNQWLPATGLVKTVSAPTGHTTIEANALHSMPDLPNAQPVTTQAPAAATSNQPWTEALESEWKALDTKLRDDPSAALSSETVTRYSVLVKQRKAALAAQQQ